MPTILFANLELRPWSFPPTPAISKRSSLQNMLWWNSFRPIICYTLCNVSWFYQVLLKIGLTLNPFARFQKSVRSVEVEWSLLFLSKKGVLTMVPFAHFLKSDQKASAWDHFFKASKKGVSLWYRLLTFAKVAKRYHSGDPFLSSWKKGSFRLSRMLTFSKVSKRLGSGA